MNRVVYVEAFFKPIGEKKSVEVPTGEMKKGFFGGEKEVKRTEYQWVQTGWSDRYIDGARLAGDVSLAIKKLNYEGYEVVSITEVTSGNYNYKYNTGVGGTAGAWGYGYGYGYSYTEGVIIISQKTDDDVSLEKGTKKCPSCAEIVKLEVIKCRFCGNAFDSAEVNQQITERRVKLAVLEKQRLEREEQRRLELMRSGRVQCPQCGEWDVFAGAVVEEGYIGDWCPHCKKSLQRMQGKI